MGYRDSIRNLEEERTFSRKAYQARKEEWTEEKIKLAVGKWGGVLEISFSHSQEGILEETERYLSYSELKLPYLAPESGYEPARRCETNTYLPRQPEKQVGYFLRTRVVLDADGNIDSANYAKIYGAIRFDARGGTLNFWYYFNPTPNDRNLEFDRMRNLSPPKSPGADVFNP